MPDLLKLAERCEAAEGPDRELDLDIMRWAENIGGDPANARPYTASIDAALMLVPKRHTWTLYADGCAGVCPKRDDDDLADGTIWAATPALALCAAALRARSKERG